MALYICLCIDSPALDLPLSVLVIELRYLVFDIYNEWWLFHAVYLIFISITNVFIGNYLFSVKVEEENTHLKEQAKFRANPAKVLHQEPFCPAKSSKPLTGTLKIQKKWLFFLKGDFLVVLLVHWQVIESPKDVPVLYIHVFHEMLVILYITSLFSSWEVFPNKNLNLCTCIETGISHYCSSWMFLNM